MAISCGIDLGTTNSCIVLVEDDGPRLVRDSYGRATVPSVVHQDAAGHVTVGHAAKTRLGQMPPPVITIKRKMGTDEQVPLGSRSLSAVEVSALILGYLKQLGEAGGSRLENAVVTVPAYFNFKQKQDTETAARQAGFKQVVVLQEPVAAALAYCVRAGDEPMIVLAYDLGGGTFDVTVLERTEEQEINVLAFGGDKYLGGDDFDTAIAEWLRQWLKRKNYAVDWDLAKLDQYAKFQRLKGIGEDAKIALSRTLETSLNHPGVFEDEEGTLVDLDVVLTRETVSGLIEEALERSVALTCETVERSGVGLGKISKLILVGGSSRIPWIQQRLRDRLGLEPELEDPDTVVALGAAIKASLTFLRRVEGREIALDLDYPSSTARPTFRLGGRLARSVRSWTARLASGDFESTVPINSDRFRFENVPLTAGGSTEFGLTVEDDGGVEQVFADIHVMQDDAVQNLKAPDAVVAKPIAVRTVDGLQVVIEAGARLPTKVRRTFHTEDQSGSIRVPIYEGGVQITEVTLSDVPRCLSVGSPVDIELVFNHDYSVKATAEVCDTRQATEIQFEIPRVRVPSMTRARAALAALQARWNAGVGGGGTGGEQAYDRLVSSIGEELAAPEPKMAKVAEELSELELRVLSLETAAIERQALRPTFDEVMERLVTAGESAENKASNGGLNLQQFGEKVQDLRARASEAWAQRDVLAWRGVISALVGLESMAAPDIRDMPRDEATQLAAQIAAFLIAELSSKGRAREVLHGYDPRQIIALMASDPHAAVLTGFAMLRKLADAGVIDLPEATRGAAASTMPPDLGGMLKGLLRSVRT